MAVYTTLFSATAAELEKRFPNVADPLSTPRTVTSTNPFTKSPIQVEVWEPEFGSQHHQTSLFSADDIPAIRPAHFQDNEYGRYLASLVPHRLRSIPHIGTKNVMFLDAEEVLGLSDSKPEKFVRCLPKEGTVDVASTQLAELLRNTELQHLFGLFPQAREAFPFAWLKTLLHVPATSQRYLCAWYQT